MYLRFPLTFIAYILRGLQSVISAVVSYTFALASIIFKSSLRAKIFADSDFRIARFRECFS